MTQDFVHLHNHTDISVQDALPSPKELAFYARRMGFPAVAITDHGRMGGVIDLVDACRKPQGDLPPIKPILGQEFYICADRKSRGESVEPGQKRPKYNHLTLLAQNEIGYRNLLEASSLAAIEGYYYDPRIDWELVQKYSEGVICLSGCLKGELAQLFLKGEDEQAYKVASKYKELFGDRYYIELQHHMIPEQKAVLPKLKELAQKLNIKVVATNDVHYLEKDDWKVHGVFIQRERISDKSKGKSGKKEAYKTHEFYLKSAEEMMLPFAGNPEALSNSLEIAERIEDYLKLDIPYLLPAAKINVDSGFGDFWRMHLPHNKENEAQLAYLAMQGLRSLGLDKNTVYKERLKYELRQIWYMGVVDYFLIQYEMVSFLREKNIMYGIRGSAVGSLVNYCLKICPVDPVRWNLMFERFLNPGRGTQYRIDYSCYPVSQWMKDTDKQDQTEYINRLKEVLSEKQKLKEYEPYIADMEKELWVLENQELAQYICDLADKGCTSDINDSQLWTAYFMGITNQKPDKELVVSKVATLPDIDTDIDDSRRDEVIDWAKNRFGNDHVVQIGTRGTYKAKAAVTNVLKLSEKFCSDWGDNISAKSIEISKTIPNRTNPPVTIDEAIQEKPEFAAWARRYPEEIAIAKKIMGKISHTSVHAAGVVISSEPISHSCPIEQRKGVLFSAFDMSGIERVGLVKYDYLGLDGFHMISKCLDMIYKRHGEKLDLTKLNFDDSKVFSLYSRGYTSTLFQAGSSGMTGSLKDVNVDCLEDLIAVFALYRPGPMDFIPDYSAGKKNPESVKYSHPIIKKHLAVTYGIMVYQEQAMFLARDLAGLSWSEVDKLRKAISKKIGKEFEASCNLLRKRATERNIPKAVIDEVLHLMEKFGGYAFNRSHSCAYAVMSYWTAYLRTYYPAEWLAACMDVDRQEEKKMAIYRRECRIAGVKVIGANVNDSGYEMVVGDDDVIILPLDSIKGVGEKGKTVVLNQPFDSFDDFVQRAKPDKGLVVSLAQGGAFDCFNECKRLDEEEILSLYESLVQERNRRAKEADRLAKMKYKVLSPMMSKKTDKANNLPIVKSARMLFEE